MATKAGLLLSDFSIAGLKPEQSRFTILITAITLLSVGFAYYASFFLGTARPNLTSKYLGLSMVGLALIAALSLFAFTVRLLISGEADPTGKVIAKARSFVEPQLLVDKVLPILLVFSFLGAFTQMKALIPVVHPFSWDIRLSEADRLIFGTDPWRLTHAVISPFATKIIDAIYLTWFPIFTTVIVYHSVFAAPDKKRRFFLTFYGTWIILGVFAATFFSSAGPCFLNLIGSAASQHYIGLCPTDAASQNVMDYLANTYVTGKLGLGTGISAMPSLHVAVAFMYFLVAQKLVTKALSACYALLIFIGSVHLGWHYAVDGLAGALGALAIYLMTRRRAEPSEHTRKQTISDLLPVGDVGRV
jgi:hypothetical protein